jgi:hypothetical protein
MTPIPTTNSERDKSRISLQIFRMHAMTIVTGQKEARSSGHLMAAELRLWTTRNEGWEISLLFSLVTH